MKGNVPIVENVLVWINSQSNMVVLNSDYSSIVLNNTTTTTYSAAKAGVLSITLGKGYAGSFLERLGLSIQYNVALNQNQITTIYNATRYRYEL